jgi:hypothetical protein
MKLTEHGSEAENKMYYNQRNARLDAWLQDMTSYFKHDLSRVRIAFHFLTVPLLKYRKGTRCAPYPAARLTAQVRLNAGLGKLFIYFLSPVEQ